MGNERLRRVRRGRIAGRYCMKITMERTLHELKTAKSAQQCRNLISRYAHLLSEFRCRELTELWSERPDTVLMAPWGSYHGKEGIRACFLRDFGDRDNPAYRERLKGCLYLHTFDTELIVVSGDLQTARAVFLIQGAEIYGRGIDSREYREKCCFMANRCGVDFICENGVWKLWHVRIWTFWHFPLETCWTDIGRYQGFLLTDNTHCDAAPPQPAYYWSRTAVLGRAEPLPPEDYEIFADVAPGYGDCFDEEAL